MDKGHGKKIYICDLDGTLLSKKSTIKHYVLERLNLYVRMGVLITFVTARDLKSVEDIMHGFESYIPFAVYNGSVVFDKREQKILKAWCLNRDLLESIFMCSDNISSPKVTYCYKCKLKNCYNVQTLQIDTMSSINLINSNTEIISITFMDTPEKIDRIRNNILNLNKFSLNIQLYANPYDAGIKILDITSSKGSKGNAALYIAKLFNIRPRDIVVFGNSENDIEMLKVAGTSCVVGNLELFDKYGDVHLEYNEGYSIVEFIEQQFRQN